MNNTKDFKTPIRKTKMINSQPINTTLCNESFIMQLKIKLLTGRVFSSNFDQLQTVYNIKEVVGEQESIHPDQINLISQGRVLQNNMTIE